MLGSTADVDARDNTNTNPNTDTSVPIYWMGGAKIADDYGDLYDGSWDSETWSGRQGTTASGSKTVWTGSEIEGREAVQNDNSQALGTGIVRFGGLNRSGEPLSAASQPAGINHAYYALSNIFVAANHAATGKPAITGTPRVNQTLSVDTSGISDPEGTDNARFTYQWVRVDDSDEADIQRATGSTYRPNDADADKRIKVKVSFTDEQGFDEGPLVSAPTATIVPRDVLVRNTGQTRTSTSSVSKDGQSFTTGPNSYGYSIESIGFLFHTIADPATASNELTTKIYTTRYVTNTPYPDNVLCTLTDPTGFSSSGIRAFRAPTTQTDLCPVLAANTTYFVVIERANSNAQVISMQYTSSDDEDPGSTPGWTIGQDAVFFQGHSWQPDYNATRIIEVRGRAATEAITSDYTTWVSNRQGDATTDYENTGNFRLAQGFRTGDTAAMFEVHEISIDFDRGQPSTDKLKVRIVESDSPDKISDTAAPSGFWKGGNYNYQTVTSDSTHTFRKDTGDGILLPNRNYFLVIESNNDDPSDAAIIRMTEDDSDISSDGWTVDDHVFVKDKRNSNPWTKHDDQVRFRIAGRYHEGLRLIDTHAYESCHGSLSGGSSLPYSSCTVAVVETEETNHLPGRRYTGSRGKGLTWISTQETIDFVIGLHPIPTGNQWVSVDYETSDWTAESGEDYIATSGTVTFRAGEKTKTIQVEIIDDGIEDSGEIVRLHVDRHLTYTGSTGTQPGDLRVTAGGGYPLPEVTRYTAYGTIYNSEETLETRYVSVSDVTVTEAEGATTILTVSLDGIMTAPVWFNYATEDGSAKAGEHYTETSGLLVIPHGETSVAIAVPILNDETYTGRKQFTLKLSNAEGAQIQNGSGTATIEDDEPAPLTAQVQDTPSSHNGVDSFTFDVTFSEDISTQYLTMQNDVFTVENGTITRAERVFGRSNHWRITVQPDSGTDLGITLPTTTDCSDTGAVCTQATPYRPLSNSHTFHLTGTPLTAEFSLRNRHDSVNDFAFQLIFSENVETTADEIKDHAVTITGGTIVSVARTVDGDNRKWSGTLQPNGRDPIILTLSQATDCQATGHICTPDGELLSAIVTGHVAGPHQISVADASVSEAAAAVLAFQVTIHPAYFSAYITVRYSTSDGTAQAGTDYTATSGTLTFRAGIPNQTIEVPVLTDTATEGTETITLTLSNPTEALIGDGEATGTINDTEAPAETAANSEPTGFPVITGTPKAQQTLTADTSGINDADGLTNVSYNYQWIQTNDGSDTDVTGETNSTYAPGTDAIGKTVKVRVSFTDDADNQHTLTSAATTAVAPSTENAVWAADMLVVAYSETSIGAASADLFSNIGSTGSLQIQSLWSYTSDHDLRLAFNEAFDDADDMTLIVGDLTLEFPPGSSGNGSFKWTGVDVDWQDGQTIEVRIVPTSTLAAPTPNTSATGQPTITGSAQVGETLTADTSQVADADGLIAVSYLYQWIADDVNIPNATGQTYILSGTDQGKALKVMVSFNDNRNNPETLTSVATEPVAARPNTPAAGAPSIQGVLQDHGRLAGDTAGIIDADGLTNATYSYQWIRVDDGTPSNITGQTGSTYTLTSDDVGESVQLQVTFTDDRGISESLNSAVTDAVVATSATRKLIWLSTIKVEDHDNLGMVFSFDSSADEGRLSPAAFAEGETTYSVAYLGTSFHETTTLGIDLSSLPTTEQTSTWRLFLLDTELEFADATMTSTEPPSYHFEWDVTALAINDRNLWHDGDVFIVSLQEAVNLPATGTPTISGTPQVGETLTAHTSAIVDGNGWSNVSLRYQWTANGSDIDGATNSSHTITSNQEGDTIQVIVLFNDDDGFSETVTSEATTAVAGGTVANIPATGLPTISGTPQVDQTLTADTSAISDQDGLNNVSYDYQWLADGSDINGATGSSLLLTSSQLGQTIQIRISFDDDAGNTETITSAATVAVTAEPTPLTASLTNVPSSHIGSGEFTFDLSFSENVKAGYERIRDDAFNVDGGEIIKAKRQTQGSNQSWTITVKPDGNGAISITLPATADCDATGAICTYDGRKLSHSTSVAVYGPE